MLGVCISVDALEVDLRFPLHPLIEECIRWWRISLSQVAPNSWHYLVVFLGECRGAGIIPTRDLFMVCFRLCKSQGDYYLTARVGFRVSGAPSNNKDWMDLDDLRGMSKVSGGKAPAARSTASTQGVEPVEEPETPVDSAEEDVLLVFHRPRSMKDLFKMKVHKDDAGYYALHMSDLAHQDPDKEMQPRWGGVEELDEGLERPVDRRGVREGTPPPAVGAGAVHTPLGGFAGPSRQGDGAGKFPTLISTLLVPFRLSPYDHCFVQNQHFHMALFDRVHDAGRLITFMDYHISNLQQEIDTLKSGGGPEAIAAAEERASELEKELEKTKRERDEALQRLEAFDKELNEARGNLSKIRRLLKEARVRARKMDDELLQSVKALESARAELLKQAIDDYKESVGFKEGLKRMGRVTYKYGYWVALARFRSLHPNSEVEEDPFTIRPEDDSIPMER
ncbi:hypothetical protein BHE74_00027765 [Ensete ventricosum]|nr:hypothetical protein BHE74_00027765 [Ensete ventricosum]